MKRLILIAALALSLCGSVLPAHAVQTVLCAAQKFQAGSASGPVTFPGLSGAYQADARGCIVANGVADIVILRAQGYAEPGSTRTMVVTTGVATGTTSFLVGTLPAGAYVQKIIYQNVTANAAGNISFGSTSGGADVVAAAACGANCLTDATLAKTLFSASATQQLFVTSSAWGNANLAITVVFAYF